MSFANAIAKIIGEAQAQDKHAALVARMRATAIELEEISKLYNTPHHANATFQKWSADDLRYEADYLEKNP